MRPDIRKIRFVTTDFFSACVAWVVFFLLRKEVLHEGTGFQSQEWLKLSGGTIVIAFFWIALYYIFGFYHNIYRKSRIKELLNLLNVSFWGCVIVFFAALLDDMGVTNYRLYYNTLAMYYALHFGISSVFKLFAISNLKSLIKKGDISFNCLLIGSPHKVSKSHSELLKANHILGFQFVGYVRHEKDASQVNESELRCWGDISNLEKVVRRCYIQRVVICIEPTEHFKIKEITNQLAGLGTKVSILPDLYQILIGSVKVEHVLGVPLIDIDHDLMPFWQTVLKRWIDVAFSTCVMVLGLPFFTAFMAITKLTSRGPVFFVQERVGKNGKTFRMIKFRSMYVNAEEAGPALATENDPRITPWGLFMRKTRIDELPQFIHVFLGDMSLVGPRPERQFFIDQITTYAPEYRHLHKIKPGITSLGQVKYGYAENIEQMLERLKYDLLYIENMSIANDFRILYFTILTVLGGKGK